MMCETEMLPACYIILFVLNISQKLKFHYLSDVL